ncbi:MAG: transposase [Desulfofustis sp. PB-SRB1]|jgi:putative transposase|nr:transposase [Desulfofustis sp. PB-SRB1]MBM1001054.1 transposase [Desulfofustis sp. PB-SRB1]HBH28518.1 transposase [Desulfofustis sp.]HBH31058.1 transposase [Desulfofustis sp.]
MARIARVIAPGHPHHIVQRGNRRQPTFFKDEDYELYIELMAQWCIRYQVDIWAYCLMPNHIHLIAVPRDETGLARAIGEAHRRYTRHVNVREKWRGHLWQERFFSNPMDEYYLLAAARYVEMNPVAAGLVKKPGDYQFSSARAHLEGVDDELVKVDPLLEMIEFWNDFLRLSTEEECMVLQKYNRTGRPLGNDTFIDTIEASLGRTLRPQKPGPKRREQ